MGETSTISNTQTHSYAELSCAKIIAACEKTIKNINDDCLEEEGIKMATTMLQLFTKLITNLKSYIYMSLFLLIMSLFLLIISSFLLFAPRNIVEYFGLFMLVAEYRSIVSLVFLSCIAVILIIFAINLIKFTIKKRSDQVIGRKLSQTSDDEKQVIKELKNYTQLTSKDPAVIENLEKNEIIYKGSQFPFSGWSYQLKDEIRSYLVKHPEVLLGLIIRSYLVKHPEVLYCKEKINNNKDK